MSPWSFGLPLAAQLVRLTGPALSAQAQSESNTIPNNRPLPLACRPSSMHRIETQIDINASAERVWSILMDFQSYARWNPFVRSIEGTPKVGGSLAVHIQPPGSNGMRFHPTVLTVEATHEFRWKGKLVIRGIFDGEHYFILEPKSDTQVIFRQGEAFSGFLVPLLRRSLDGATKQGFAAMNEALKWEAERA